MNKTAVLTEEKPARKKPGRQPGTNNRILHVALAEQVAEVAKTGKKMTKKQMLLNAGYALSMSKRPISAQPWSSEGFKQALAERGIDMSEIARTLEHAKKANIATIFRGVATESDVPDHSIRLKAIDQLAEYTGLKKHHVQVTSVNVDVKPEDALDLLGL